MGYRISWLAVRSDHQPRLLATLGLADTGDTDEANEAPLSLSNMPTGWSVLWANDENFVDDTLAASLSVEIGPVIAVRVNETCMHMTAALFDAGARRWRVHHEGDSQIDMLERDGELPPELDAIEAEQRRLQAEDGGDTADVDHMSAVPLELARTICGYKHDLWRFDWGEPVFTRVAPVQPVSGRGWLKRVFGRP